MEYKTENTKVSLSNVSLDDLVLAFQKFLERSLEDKPINTKITKKELSVEEKMSDIKSKFKGNKRISFNNLFDIYDKPNLIVTFLAILELAKKCEIQIIQENNFGEIMCEVVNGN